MSYIIYYIIKYLKKIYNFQIKKIKNIQYRK